MAEMIRRTAERVFETELPEEDEIGCGSGEETADFKEDFYGRMLTPMPSGKG